MLRKLPIKQNFQNIAFVIIGLSLAIIIRWYLIYYVTLDYYIYLNPWVDFIQEHGGLPALKYPFSNYTPPYSYLLIISWHIFNGMPNIFIIKIISISFALILAYIITSVISIRYSKDRDIVFVIVLIYPSVFLNSATWGQADIIYTTWLIASLYFILRKQNSLAFVFWGLAIAFKAQAIFLLPLYIILLFYRRVSWKHFIIIPIIYFISILPAWIAGRSLIDLLSIYFNQAQTYNAITMNAPNLYQWLPSGQYETLLVVGLIVSAAVVILLITFVVKARFPITDDLIIELALMSCLLLPFFLPKMHDRYFFPADILALLLFLYQRKRFYILILIELGSILTYSRFLLLHEFISLKLIAFLFLAAIILLANNIHHQAKDLRSSR